MLYSVLTDEEMAALPSFHTTTVASSSWKRIAVFTRRRMMIVAAEDAHHRGGVVKRSSIDRSLERGLAEEEVAVGRHVVAAVGVEVEASGRGGSVGRCAEGGMEAEGARVVES
ncbi:hypothetical protein GUJ93_ZPchr0001g30068 [Zizania palustris]|uniref:Uncharacterized protein n=1 Tax=Zizania palustris TaxID=103762 RepID=A0A8J5RWA4_ZIZPA|nr:hypothetical protein GUJ93_ZPchr0001g30068 [Zizania palustris]